jgi:hypothetical protein
MSMYSAINMDIAMGEISERVLENTVYEDAYMYYKKRSSGKEIKKKLNKVEDKKEEPAPKTSWVFKRAK